MGNNLEKWNRAAAYQDNREDKSSEEKPSEVVGSKESSLDSESLVDFSVNEMNSRILISELIDWICSHKH